MWMIYTGLTGLNLGNMWGTKSSERGSGEEYKIQAT